MDAEKTETEKQMGCIARSATHGASEKEEVETDGYRVKPRAK